MASVANSIPVASSAPRIRTRGRRGGGGGGGGVAIFGGVLVLLLVSVGIYLMTKASAKTPKENLKKRVQGLKLKSESKTKLVLKAMVEKQGLTMEEAKAEREKVITEFNALPGDDCPFSQPMVGVDGITCGRNFSFDKDSQCCMPEGDAPPDIQDVLKDLAIDLVKSILIDEMMEQMIAVGIFLAAKAIAFVIKLVTKAAVQLFANLTLAAVAGPVGWALLAFDMLSMAIDFLDPKGYDMFSANSVLQRKVEIAAYAQWTMVTLDKKSWPMMISMKQAYPDAYEIFVTPMIIEKYTPKAWGLMLKDYAAAEIKALGDDPDRTKYGEVFKPYFAKALNANPLARDKLILELLNEGINENQRGDQVLIPAMTTADRIGITMTEKACIKWNKRHFPAWVNWVNNLTGTENNKYVDEKSGDLVPNEDAEGNPLPPPCFANWTDWCYVPDEVAMSTTKWTEGKPPMKKVKLKDMPAIKANNPTGEDVWCALWSADMDSAYVMCTGKQERKGEKGKEDIVWYPTKYGVKWENGECKYTKKYCDYMNLKFKNNDCIPWPGQAVAENIFGSTITPRIYRLGK